MALLDIFKRKKIKERKRKVEKKPAKKKIEKKEEIQKPRETQKPRPIRKRGGISAYKILKAPHITEKATNLLDKNQYLFEVWPESNKTEIKKTIEGMYGVNVINVRIINIHPKKRRLGRTTGWKKGHKKAIVRLKEGQKIEVLPR